MTGRLRVTYARSEALDLFLALHRELAGRFSWEISILPRPVTADVARLRDGVRKWREAGLDSLPAWLAAGAPHDLLGLEAGAAIRDGTQDVVAALEAAGAELRAALSSLEELRMEAARTLDSGLCLDEVGPPLRAALGVGPAASAFRCIACRLRRCPRPVSWRRARASPLRTWTAAGTGARTWSRAC